MWHNSNQGPHFTNLFKMAPSGVKAPAKIPAVGNLNQPGSSSAGLMPMAPKAPELGAGQAIPAALNTSMPAPGNSLVNRVPIMNKIPQNPYKFTNIGKIDKFPRLFKVVKS